MRSSDVRPAEPFRCQRHRRAPRQCRSGGVVHAGQRKVAFGLGTGKAATFFLNHQPILAYNSDGTSEPMLGNTVLQRAPQSLPTGEASTALFPSHVQAAFSGHVHRWEIVTYASGLPPAFVSGNGGSDRVERLTDLSGVGAPVAGAMVAQFLSAGNFGDMMLGRAAAGWKMNVYDLGGTVIAACTLAAGNATCTSVAKGG